MAYYIEQSLNTAFVWLPRLPRGRRRKIIFALCRCKDLTRRRLFEQTVIDLHQKSDRIDTRASAKMFASSIVFHI